LAGDRGVNLAQQYGAGRLPVTFLISADGRILQRWDGLALPSQLAASLMAFFGQP
jgi:peroxiredoxin